jgi:hypothetical protein
MMTMSGRPPMPVWLPLLGLWTHVIVIVEDDTVTCGRHH